MSWILDYLWWPTTAVAAAGRNVPPGVDIKAIPETLRGVSAEQIVQASKRLRPTPARSVVFTKSDLDLAITEALPRLRHVETRVAEHVWGRVIDRYDLS